MVGLRVRMPTLPKAWEERVAEQQHPQREGGGAIRRTARSVGRGIRAVGRWYKWSVIGDTREITQSAAALRARLHEVLHAGDYARHETFAAACERLGLNAEDLVRRRSELQLAARMFLIVALITLFVFAYLPWSAHPVSHALFCSLVLTMALSRYSVVRWRQAQCEQCELMPYLSYWRRWWRV